MIESSSLKEYYKSIENKERASYEMQSKNAAITIWKGYDRKNQSNVIIKIFNLAEDKYNEYYTESTAYKNLSHSKIITPYAYGIITDNYEKEYGIIVLPYAEGGDLLKALEEQEWKYKENEFLRFAYNLISTIHYFHSKGLIHRDLKIENIVLKSAHYQQNRFPFDPDSFMIIDFGSSMYIHDNNYDINKPFRKTISYTPPEYMNQKAISKKYDIYSAGIILYILVTAELPSFCNQIDIDDEVYEYDIDEYFYQDEWEYVDSKIQDLIKSMLNFDPSKRPDTESILTLKIFSNKDSK